MSKDDAKATRVLQQRLGAAIRNVRKQQYSSLVHLGVEVGQDSGNLSRIERGAQWPSPMMLLRLSRVLRWPMWLWFATAENALSTKELELIKTYQTSDEEGKSLIDKAVEVATKHYRRGEQVGERKHGAARVWDKVRSHQGR